jgi:death-on-curing family protein
MLGARYVEYIHDELIAELWADAGAISAKGCRDFNLLESAVSRPFQTVFGRDAYPTILDKSVALFHSLISNHPFHDGNKRTAVSSLYVFLLANGCYFALTNIDAYELAKAAASYRERGLTHEEIFGQIRERLQDSVLPFASMRVAAKKDVAFRSTFEKAKKLRVLIRKGRLNRLIQSE